MTKLSIPERIPQLNMIGYAKYSTSSLVPAKKNFVLCDSDDDALLEWVRLNPGIRESQTTEVLSCTTVPHSVSALCSFCLFPAEWRHMCTRMHALKLRLARIVL